MLLDIWNFIDGKKTYIAAGGLMALGTAKLLNGDMSGWQMLMSGLGMLGLRHAIAKQSDLVA